MSIMMFNNEKPKEVRNIKRNDVRRPHVDPSKINEDIMNKPIHLATRKKELLNEKKGLLQKIKDKKRKKL